MSDEKVTEHKKTAPIKSGSGTGSEGWRRLEQLINTNFDDRCTATVFNYTGDRSGDIHGIYNRCQERVEAIIRKEMLSQIVSPFRIDCRERYKTVIYAGKVFYGKPDSAIQNSVFVRCK